MWKKLWNWNCGTGLQDWNYGTAELELWNWNRKTWNCGTGTEEKKSETSKKLKREQHLGFQRGNLELWNWN
jgi:hypothetical protein